MKRSMGFGLCILLGIAWTTTQGEQPVKPVETLMRAKLIHSQSILEGLTSEDFVQIAKDAQALTLLSEEAGWQVVQTVDYIRHSDQFRRNTKALSDAAQRKNLDGATLAYVQVTLNCVECHKYVRSVQQAR